MHRTLASLCCLLVLSVTVHAEVVRYVPAAASNPGVGDTYWTTDLWILSQVLDGPIEVRVALLSAELAEGEEPAEVAVEVPPRSAVHLEDVVGDLLGAHRPGALRLRCEHPFDVRSRTSGSRADGGRFGQEIPAVEHERRLLQRPSWILLGAANQPGEDGVRCNLGLYEIHGREGGIDVTVIDQASGEVIGEPEAEVRVGPFGWRQVDLFHLVGAPQLAVENALVRVRGSLDSTYLSCIDNRSGDATFIEPVRERWDLLVPVAWDVTLTVNHHHDVVVDSVVYTGAHGQNLVAVDVEDGWTVSQRLSSSVDLCVEVTGTGGGIVLEVRRTAVQGSGGGSTGIFWPFTNQPSTFEHCFPLP